MTTGMFVPGAYKIENYAGEVIGGVTNKTPYGAHRGFSKSEACFVIERLIDIIAERLALDPLRYASETSFLSKSLLTFP